MNSTNSINSTNSQKWMIDSPRLQFLKTKIGAKRKVEGNEQYGASYEKQYVGSYLITDQQQQLNCRNKYCRSNLKNERSVVFCDQKTAGVSQLFTLKQFLVFGFWQVDFNLQSKFLFK